MLVSVLAMAIFGTLAGPLHIAGIQSASAQGNNLTAFGNQTSGNMTASGNQTSSSDEEGDLAQGDPDGDGI
ncbi:hypothetical protein [Candidatus Nitrososphaera evergladensis]|uniref:hypothetical protein n=1 Tax=Candidatus Nitrososphaera evergladensis TaxID=1459637 RepID=UPI0011E5C3A8|nr:hypothetical protein [Candidatus Nitrososphaera evergladensis]